MENAINASNSRCPYKNSVPNLSISLANPLPVHLNLHTSQIHRPSRTCLLHPRRQPGLRLPVVERPLRHDEYESKNGAAQSDVKRFVDVLSAEADNHSNNAGSNKEEGGEEIG